MRERLIQADLPGTLSWHGCVRESPGPSVLTYTYLYHPIPTTHFHNTFPFSRCFLSRGLPKGIGERDEDQRRAHVSVPCSKFIDPKARKSWGPRFFPDRASTKHTDTQAHDMTIVYLYVCTHTNILTHVYTIHMYTWACIDTHAYYVYIYIYIHVSIHIHMTCG